MLLPSVLAILTPVCLGFTFGPDLMLGVLIGSAASAIVLAVYNGNSGGAYDNNKKAIEIVIAAQRREKKEVDPELLLALKAAVIGDTVGDTRKDVVGVSLDIFIKTMSTVSNTLAPLFSAFHLF